MKEKDRFNEVAKENYKGVFYTKIQIIKNDNKNRNTGKENLTPQVSSCVLRLFTIDNEKQKTLNILTYTCLLSYKRGYKGVVKPPPYLKIFNKRLKREDLLILLSFSYQPTTFKRLATTYKSSTTPAFNGN